MTEGVKQNLGFFLEYLTSAKDHGGTERFFQAENEQRHLRQKHQPGQSDEGVKIQEVQLYFFFSRKRRELDFVSTYYVQDIYICYHISSFYLSCQESIVLSILRGRKETVITFSNLFGLHVRKWQLCVMLTFSHQGAWWRAGRIEMG